jgi:hypothetical protein
MSDPPRDRWNATPKRVLLGEQLVKRTTPRLTAYYWEAIRALREADDEIRFSIAGHALRELQNGLPHHLEVPEERGRLGDFFNWLRDQWRKLLPGRPPKVDAELWTGLEIDRPFGVFLGTLHEKIETYAGVYPRRREMHRIALGHLDPGLSRAPDAIQEAVVTTWMENLDLPRLRQETAPEDHLEPGRGRVRTHRGPRLRARASLIQQPCHERPHDLLGMSSEQREVAFAGHVVLDD